MGTNGNGSNGSHSPKLLTAGTVTMAGIADEAGLTAWERLDEIKQKFVITVMREGNAHKAAKVMGLPHPTSYGYRMLKSAEVQAALGEILESRKVRKDVIEVEAGDLSFAKLADFMDDETGEISWRKVRENSHLVKKYKTKRYVEGKGEAAREVEVEEIELHDRQTAMMNVAKLCGWVSGDTNINIQVNAFQEIVADLTPLLRDCLDPAKLEAFATGMAALMTKYQNPNMLAMAGAGQNAQSRLVEADGHTKTLKTGTNGTNSHP